MWQTLRSTLHRKNVVVALYVFSCLRSFALPTRSEMLALPACVALNRWRVGIMTTLCVCTYAYAHAYDPSTVNFCFRRGTCLACKPPGRRHRVLRHLFASFVPADPIPSLLVSVRLSGLLSMQGTSRRNWGSCASWSRCTSTTTSCRVRAVGCKLKL